MLIFILLTEIHAVVTIVLQCSINDTGKGNIQRRLDPLHISNRKE
jgi:hypothetical protein